jgi:hypothetical protein
MQRRVKFGALAVATSTAVLVLAAVPAMAHAHTTSKPLTGPEVIWDCCTIR